MKTLPFLTVGLTLSLTTTCAILAYRHTLAQEAEKPAVKAEDSPKKPGGTAEKSSEKSSEKSAEKQSPRRNEASGAVAIVTLEEARDRLINYQSIRAKVRQTVSIGDRQFQLKGNYQQGDGLKLRLEYEVELGGTKGQLVEVCDGQLLFTLQTIGKEQRSTRRNVRQILEAAAAAERTSETLLHAELGLGGLPGMMASIQKSIQFEKQWEQDYEGQPFVVLDGTWKPEIRSKFVGAKEGDAPLPSYVPDRLRVYFEKQSLFPRRILYLKKYDAQKMTRPMVSIDFVDVETNKPLDDAAFSFKLPEKAESPTDVTDEFVKLFQKKPAGEAEKK